MNPMLSSARVFAPLLAAVCFGRRLRRPRPARRGRVDNQGMVQLARALALCLATLAFTQCSVPVSVRVEKPVPPVGAPAAKSSIGTLLAATREAHEWIRRSDDSAIPAYNYAVARLVEELKRSGATPWNSPLAVAGVPGVTTLRTRNQSDIDPASAQFYPTDTLVFHGDYAGHQSVVSGIGAPLAVAESFAGIGHTQMRKHVPVRNFTAIVRFEGSVATLELVDPYQMEAVSLAGKSRTLAADYGAAMMLALSKARVDKLGIARLLRPSRYDNTANLNFAQPYDPKRIPVLFVHGLDSTPATFAPAYFELLKDPVIRKNYQFWVFSYPSGYPYPYSAVLLRRELDSVKRDFPGHRDIVIVGHSMGSLISRLMVTNAGDKLWLKAFGHPPAETQMAGASKKLLEEALIFENRKEIKRAVFASGPHRGSELATHWIGRLGARLVKLPGLMADVRNTMLSAATADVAGLAIQSAPNSIGTLSPNNPFVREINKLPIAPGVTYHSIMGDRGKGDTPKSSDGVVAYWSSHLDGAASEKIVPSGHGSHAHPEGIAEIHRILILNLQNHP
ncbi:MAG: alpha/beta fold hydrolase [Verrucomicrobia bacterium]|nr:alpha/beta fold hydrolase [Verrucomicrobiota bacterium]